MVTDFAWGTASAQPVTLSFWVISSLTGTFSGAVSTSLIPELTRSPSPSRPQHVDEDRPHHSRRHRRNMGDERQRASVLIKFDLVAGRLFAARRAHGRQRTRWANGGKQRRRRHRRTVNITGVKLEIGTVATPFPQESLAKRMADCQRYFCYLGFNMRGNAPTASFQLGAPITFPAMRAAPTISAIATDPNITPSASNNGATGFVNITPYSAMAYMVISAPGEALIYGYRSSASAEL